MDTLQKFFFWPFHLPSTWEESGIKIDFGKLDFLPSQQGHLTGSVSDTLSFSPFIILRIMTWKIWQNHTSWIPQNIFGKKRQMNDCNFQEIIFLNQQSLCFTVEDTYVFRDTEGPIIGQF